MDPTSCLDTLRAALESGDRAEARGAALSLREWIARGGFPPSGHSAESAMSLVAEALSRR